MASCYRLDYAIDADPSNGLRRLAFKSRANAYDYFSIF
jgi:hypothetical protein